jgi:uncharacterized protein (DUF58 family)
MQANKIIPLPVEAAATRSKRLGWAFGSRFFLLLVIGMLFLGPAFVDSVFLWAMLAWDIAILLLWFADLRRLPSPAALIFRREFPHAATLATSCAVVVNVENSSSRPIHLELVDDVPPELDSAPARLACDLSANAEITVAYAVQPRKRGDCLMGDLYLRYRSAWQLAECWARVALPQTVRVYPSTQDSSDQSIYLMRSRQIALEKRFSRHRGFGREFESLRDYRQGDNYRDISWTATARRGKLVTREYQVERSQPVWLVVDCGRLMRTRVGSLSKLDYAASAALSLAQVALFGGDKVGLMAYGLNDQRMVGIGKGTLHLRNIMEQLAAAAEESAEASHLRAAVTLMNVQSRRSLIVYLTDLADTAMLPEVIEGATMLQGRHLVLFAVVEDPELKRVAFSKPASDAELYRVTAAREIVHRRELMIAQLRARGAHTLEIAPRGLSSALVERYLELKSRNLI